MHRELMRSPYSHRSWQMERTLSFFDRSSHAASHDRYVAVVGQFKIVDTCHDAGEVVVRRVRLLAGLANHSKHWSQALEPYLKLESSILKEGWKSKHTANWKLGATSGELQEVSSFRQSQLTHGLKQVSNAFAVHVESMVCFDRVHEC